MTEFQFAETGETLNVEIKEMIIAGWAGREQAGIDEHIEELKAIGVAPPSSTPLFYRVSAGLVTTANQVQFLGNETSGEIEVLLIGTEHGTVVGLAQITRIGKPKPGRSPIPNRCVPNR